jgi:TolB-like protein
MPAEDIEAPEVFSVLSRVLASTHFAKSQRMSRLLRFVVEKAIAGETHLLNEYAIGLEVFDRDAATYNPGDDPIVRVQVGRLREKLQRYYANGDGRPSIRFEIPLGTYAPTIKRFRPVEQPGAQNRKLMIFPIKAISVDANAAQFALGLREELIHCLFQSLGDTVISAEAHTAPDSATGRFTPLVDAVDAGLVLEGSIRIEDAHVRVTLRLMDTESGCLVWSAQFDRAINGMIATQEALALAICNALRAQVERTSSGAGLQQ